MLLGNGNRMADDDILIEFGDPSFDPDRCKFSFSSLVSSYFSASLYLPLYFVLQFNSIFFFFFLFCLFFAVTKDLFVKTSERKARLQYDELAKTKESAADELKRSVYNNYPCFISTSKEISSILLYIYSYLPPSCILV